MLLRHVLSPCIPPSQKAMSVMEVKSPMTYENGVPSEEGLLDLRMGTTDREFRCKTCAGKREGGEQRGGHAMEHVMEVRFVPMYLDVCFVMHSMSLMHMLASGDMAECPGHFGHIELAKPCLHIGFMPTILKVLRCVCFHCSSLLVSPDHKNYRHATRLKNPAKRLAAMHRMCSGLKRCNGGFDVEEENPDGDDTNKVRRTSKPCKCDRMMMSA